MTSIAALSPVSPPSPVPAAASGEGAGFAPVIAGMLANGGGTAAATPLPDQSGPAPATGNIVPLPGSPAPLVEAPPPSAPGEPPFAPDILMAGPPVVATDAGDVDPPRTDMPPPPPGPQGRCETVVPERFTSRRPVLHAPSSQDDPAADDDAPVPDTALALGPPATPASLAAPASQSALLLPPPVRQEKSAPSRSDADQPSPSVPLSLLGASASTIASVASAPLGSPPAVRPVEPDPAASMAPSSPTARCDVVIGPMPRAGARLRGAGVADPEPAKPESDAGSDVTPDQRAASRNDAASSAVLAAPVAAPPAPGTVSTASLLPQTTAPAPAAPVPPVTSGAAGISGASPIPLERLDPAPPMQAAVPLAVMARPEPTAPAASLVPGAMPQLSPRPESPPVVRGATSMPPASLATLPLPPVHAPPGPAILPALQAFGAAMHRAAADERRSGLPDPAALASPIAPAAPSTVPPVTDPAPLDTTQQRWPEAMIARIEQLRDLANEGDTRIRLHPDALGHLDVALRREGEAVHVHFTAAEPATQRLIADAQPRLQELAEARGLKLSGAHVGSGSGGGGERRPPAPPQPTRPRAPRAATVPDTHDDTRLA